MILAHRSKTIAAIVVWGTLLVGAWFSAPMLLRSWLLLTAELPHRAIALPVSVGERAEIVGEIAGFKRAIFNKKQNGNTNLTPEYLAIGIRYEKLGAYWKARSVLSRVTEKEPQNAIAWMHAARAFEGLTLTASAADAWRHAIETDWKNPSHYARLAHLFDRSFHDTFTANGIYLEGLVRAGNPPELMRSYALFLENIGERRTALLYWKALLEKEPQDRSIQDRINDLESVL